ncbi:MAG: phosphoribulokinase [Rhizobiaceae bacterium]
MSKKHPIISITGSSGAGTTSVQKTFHDIFRREGIKSADIEGDAFHRYDRAGMKEAMKEAEKNPNHHFSHFGPEANILNKLADVFEEYGQTGQGQTRQYIHNDEEAAVHGSASGTFTDWRSFDEDTDLMFYEGLHGAVVSDDVNVAQHADLKVGVVPVINLEWTQKIHRDSSERGYAKEVIMDTILRRMHDYVHYITPQFTETDINFQRVPLVDTSNPFIARSIPTADESMVVIRFANPRGIDFQYLLSMIHDSFMSRANSIVVPGNKMELAMQLIFTPMIMKLVDQSRRAGSASGRT